MNGTPRPDLTSRLAEIVAARTALHFPKARWGELERRVGPTASEFGFDDTGAFVDWLAATPMTREQTEILANHLTNNETYFWREPKVFEALGAQFLPELIRSREANDRRLRIWSAGCSTGEEPYSIAIALHRALPDLADWQVTILATDINPRALREAAAGIYGERSFRNAPPWLKEGYFRPTGDGKREILPKVRKMVAFAYLNLAEDCYPSPLNNTNAMDVVFCRNVLMYFAPERARQVGQNLHRSLVEGGWLVVSSCELSEQLFPQFECASFPDAMVYRKRDRRPETGDQTPGTGDRPVFRLPSPVSTTPLADRPETESPNAVALSVRALANQGRLAEALALCAKALAACKLDAGLHYLHATILQELNREAEAIASLRRALYLDPDFVPAHFAMGNLALRQGDRRTGKRSFKNALALLNGHREEDILTESEGLTAGRFREIVNATLQILMRAGNVCHSEAFDAEESSSAKTLRYAQGDRV